MKWLPTVLQGLAIAVPALLFLGGIYNQAKIDGEHLARLEAIVAAMKEDLLRHELSTCPPPRAGL